MTPAHPPQRTTSARLDATHDDTSLLRPVVGWVECHDCGLAQALPHAPDGQTIRCCRCHSKLGTTRADPLGTATACTVASLCLYLVALAFPLMTLDLRGRIHTVDILTGPANLLGTGSVLAIVGGIVLFASVLMPGVIIGANLMLFWGARQQPVARIVPHLLRLQQKFRPWSMVEVYMLGIFVAWSKLISLAHVELDPAIFALAAIMVLMIASDAAFDSRAVWNRIGMERGTFGRALEEPPQDEARIIACHGCELVLACDSGDDGGGAPPALEGARCPRCHTSLLRRKPDSLRRTTMFLLGATILYLPANVLPVLTFTKLGHGQPSTILAGVEELYEGGMLPLALLVFFASITVPCLKVVSLAGMVWMTHRRSSVLLLDRTRLFRIVDFIGRWSMIDVFMISILVALVRFGFLANVVADPGCVAFALVVVLTIFAANSFDPRLMWDAAEAHDHAPSGARLPSVQPPARPSQPSGLPKPA